MNCAKASSQIARVSPPKALRMEVEKLELSKDKVQRVFNEWSDVFEIGKKF